MLLLKIRSKQAQRELNDLGLYLFLFVLFLILLLIISNSLNKDVLSSTYQLLFLFTLCLTIQFYRSDKKFIYLHIKNPHFEIYSEYFTLTIPFSCSVLITSHWYYFLIFQILLALIPFIHLSFSSHNSYFKSIPKFIDSTGFEYLSGVRHSFYHLIPLYLLALSFSWFNIFPLILLWLITVTFTSFYYECEPLNILRNNRNSPRQFLWFKIQLHSKYLLFLYIPVLLVNTLFNQGYWLINLLFLLLQLSLLVFAITLKYSCYQPNENLKRNKIILSIVSLGAILPYFLPVPLFMAKVYFHKAIKNLNRFL
jgi:hypothetical protein